ncbi:MAG: Stage V sporulation protein B [Firmicutes bacterium ADurb.Bin182]|nr:MAG: Stage V sporulation protein B [Firmicutes bacterium ADurb.Bin182]
MKRALAGHALILTGTALLNRFADMFFTVYISNKIGPEGMGLLQLILSVYFAAAVISTSGISMAVIRLVSEETGRGSEKNARFVLKKSCILSLYLSVFAALALFFFSGPIGNDILRDGRTVSALKFLAPSLPFMGISSCIRGYFHGVKNTVKPSSSLLLEQLIRFLSTAVLLEVMLPKGLEYACIAASCGSVISEAGACLYLILLYRFEKRKRMSGSGPRGIIKRIAAVCFPLAASSYVRSFLNTVENIMIPAGLEKFGASPKASLEQYGILKGMAMPLLIFPSVFLSSVSTILIPVISEANVLQQKNKIRYVITRVIQFTSLLSVLIAGLFILFAGDLGVLIYRSAEVGPVLFKLAPLVPLIYLDFATDGMLIGLNQQVSSLKYNVLDSMLKVGLLFVLIPKMGVDGLILVLFCTKILNMTLSIGRLLMVSKLKLQLMNCIIKPVFSIVAAGFAAAFLYRSTASCKIHNGAMLALEMIPVIAVYFLLLILTGCIKTDDIDWFKSIFRNKSAPHIAGETAGRSLR